MISIVIDAGYGDSGKGTVVDYLVRKTLESDSGYKPVVVRFNGGHQCGHRVVHKDKEHVFSNFGSGTLRGATTYWGRECTIDPVGFMKEYEVLVKKGITPTIYADPECMITTPYDKENNHIVEGLYKHGSTGVGFGATIARNEGTHKLRLIELRNAKMLKWKMSKMSSQSKVSYKEDDEFYKAVDQMLDVITVISEEQYFTKGIGKHYIFEGNQGIMLDHEYGFFPHVTRSNTMSRGVERYVKMMPHYIPEMYYVSRAYSTRHGNGPFPGEEHSKALKLKNTENEKNIRDVWQGDFRTAPLNYDLLKYALMIDGYTRRFTTVPNTLFITCNDQLKGKFPVIKDNKVYWYKQASDSLDDLYHNVRYTTSEQWSSTIF